MDDAISRAEIIRLILEHGLYCDTQADRETSAEIIRQLPSAQPEIIRCKDCKHVQEDKIFHQYWCNGKEVKPDHFCGYAERRTDD